MLAEIACFIAIAQPSDQGQIALRHMADAYKAAKSLEFEATITVREGVDLDHPSVYAAKVALLKPNKLYALVTPAGAKSDDKWLLVCDGETVWQFEAKSNRYRKEPSPKDMMNLLPDLGPLKWLSLQAFFAVDPYAALTRKVRTVTYAGKERLDGEWCTAAERLLDGRRRSLIWISPEDHIPRKSSSFLTVAGSEMEMYREERSAVKVDGPVPKGLFNFTPPKDAVEAPNPAPTP